MSAVATTGPGAAAATAAATAPARRKPPRTRPTGDYLRFSRSKRSSWQIRKRFASGLPIKVADDGRADDYPFTVVGVHVGQTVWVTGKQEKMTLYLQGFFGKGMLSKAEPMFDETVRKLNMRRLAVSSSERQLQRKLNREKIKERRKRRVLQRQQQQQQQQQQHKNVPVEQLLPVALLDPPPAPSAAAADNMTDNMADNMAEDTPMDPKWDVTQLLNVDGVEAYASGITYTPVEGVNLQGPSLLSPSSSSSSPSRKRPMNDNADELVSTAVRSDIAAPSLTTPTTAENMDEEDEDEYEGEAGEAEDDDDDQEEDEDEYQTNEDEDEGQQEGKDAEANGDEALASSTGQNGMKPPKRKRFEKVDEFLQLGLEEAFFLTFGLGCLRVKRDRLDTIPMNIQQCWTAFCEHVRGFPVAYAAYHHLRSKGWVPKSGLKYGVDWVIYRQGPVFFHSDFSVIVFPVYASPDRGPVPDEIGSSPHAPLNWQLLSNLNRVSGQVVKDILLLYVVVPDDLTLTECATPRVLDRLTVREVPLRRWIPEKDR